MQTQTTIESVERTPSGAYKIVFQGGAVAGTANAAIGDEAVRIAAAAEPNPVQVTVEKIAGDKLEVMSIQEITPPEELGGTAEPAPVVEAAAEPTLDDVLTKGLEAYSDEALLAEVARRMGS